MILIGCFVCDSDWLFVYCLQALVLSMQAMFIATEKRHNFVIALSTILVNLHVTIVMMLDLYVLVSTVGMH